MVSTVEGEAHRVTARIAQLGAPEFMVMVTINFKEEYIEDLKKRMARHQISQAALAREMKPPVTASQATRWFTKNPNRRVSPELDTVRRIEEAMERLQKRKAR